MGKHSPRSLHLLTEISQHQGVDQSALLAQGWKAADIDSLHEARLITRTGGGRIAITRAGRDELK